MILGAEANLGSFFRSKFVDVQKFFTVWDSSIPSGWKQKSSPLRSGEGLRLGPSVRFSLVESIAEKIVLRIDFQTLLLGLATYGPRAGFSPPRKIIRPATSNAKCGNSAANKIDWAAVMKQLRVETEELFLDFCNNYYLNKNNHA